MANHKKGKSNLFLIRIISNSSKLALISVLTVVLLFSTVDTAAQVAPWYTPIKVNDTTSWFGNTYNGAYFENTTKSRLVQHYIDDIFVTSGGTVYSNAAWEEHGSGVQEYKNGEWINNADVGNHGGGFSVTANSKYIFFGGDERRSNEEGIDRRNRYDISNRELNVHVNIGNRVYGLVAMENKVFASLPELNLIQVYDTDLNFIKQWTLEDAHEMCLDEENHLWIIQKTANKIVRFDTSGTKLPQEIVLADSIIPTDICMDNEGRLLVADEGPNEQIRIYTEITTSPVLHSTFGVQRGVYAGVSGKYENMEFVNPQGIGVDSFGNIYVASSPQHTTIIQSYSPEGTLNWELSCQAWIHCAAFHPDTEDTVYLPNKKFLMDFNNPPGEEATPYSTIVDKNRFPDDTYRNTGGVFMRKLSNGKIYLFSVTQNGSDFSYYRFDREKYDEISLPSGLITDREMWVDQNGNGHMEESEKSQQPKELRHRHFWVDRQGAIWAMTRTDGIFKYTLQGFTENEVPIYSIATRVNFSMPEPFTELRRIMYFPENDVMYLGGSTAEHQAQHWKPLGPNVIRYENWHGERKQKWHLVLPYDTKEEIKHESWEASGMDIEGEYMFFVYKPIPAYGFKNGRVIVFKKETAEYVGYMEQPESWGDFGLPDMVQAINAYKRSNGEYVVIVEDDYKSKQVMYRWCPTGDCMESSMKIKLNAPPNDTLLFTYNGITLEPDIIADTCTIEKVEYYANNTLIGSSENAPYTFTIPDTSLGKTELQAKLISASGAYKFSEKRYLTISNGTPVVTLSTPLQDSEHNMNDTVKLSAETFDYDGLVDSVIFYANDMRVGYDTAAPFSFDWIIPETANYQVYAVARDDSGKTGTSQPVDMISYGYRPADNPESVRSGLIYKYFEGEWEKLPDFSKLTPLHKDTITHFEIDSFGRINNFAYRFTGYVQIAEKGRYTFYTSSNDGSRLFIGDRMIVDNDGIHVTMEKSGVVLLEEGLHRIEVTMFDELGVDNLTVSYSGPEIEKQEIPGAVLFRAVGTPPTISIESPQQSDIYNQGDTVWFKASVTDPDEDVNRIEFYTGNEWLGNIADTGYHLPVDTLKAGTLEITARAYDLGGSISVSEPVSFTINAHPQIHFTYPENLSKYNAMETIYVEVEVIDDNPREMHFYVNERLGKTLTQSPWTFQLNNLAIGSYFIKAVVIDENNLEASARIEVRVVNTPPSISIIQPDSGEVFVRGEAIQLIAQVTDPDNDVYKVAFYEQDIQLGTNANIMYETTVRNLTVGDYNIVAKAFDKAGATGESDRVHISVIHPVSVLEMNMRHGINIFPNPLEGGHLTIQIENKTDSEPDIQISVSDISGRIIFEKEVRSRSSEFKLDYEIFKEKGMFFICLRTDKVLEVQKVIVQ